MPGSTCKYALFSNCISVDLLAQVQVTSTLCISSFIRNHGGQGYARSKEGSSPQEGHEGNEGQEEVKVLETQQLFSWAVASPRSAARKCSTTLEPTVVIATVS